MTTRRLLPFALSVLVLLMAAGPASAAKRYVGYMGDGSGRAYEVKGQGGLHQLLLTDAEFSNRAYRVCIRGGGGQIRRCFSRRLNLGFDKVNVSVLVNDKGGPGRYRVTWFVAGRTVAGWRFTLRPEND